MAANGENHGHSTAAWTAVSVILLGCVIASVAVLLPSVPLGIVGAAVIILGAIVGKVMSMAGFGSDGHHAQAGGGLTDAPDEVGVQTRGKN